MVKQEELYITGPVILNGIPDSDGDTLNNVEIRTIFTKYTKHLSDIQHDYLDYEGVNVLANWISEEETTIAGNTIPAKSWLCTMKITDSETLTAIKKGELNGFSLGSVPSKAKTREAWFINKRISYHDLKSIEDVIPLRISIVDSGANEYPFEIQDYTTYINKNKGEKKVTDESKFTLKDLKQMFSFKKELEDELSINKAEEQVEPTTVEPANDAEKTIDALFEKIDAIQAELAEIKEAIATPIDKAEDETEEEKAEEPANTTESETDEEEDKVEKADNDDNTETETESETETETDEEKEEEEVEETKINKRTEKPLDNPVTETKSNFYTNTGRDHFGRKIRQ